MTSKKKIYPHAWNKEVIHSILQDLDSFFAMKKKKIEVMMIGGVSIVLQEYQNRTTNDFDLVPTSDSLEFVQACKELGCEAQIITLSTTVDFGDVKSIEIFRGTHLRVLSVTAEDLIRLKLERFRKQDPEDIYAIIEKDHLPYERFAKLVEEGSVVYVGRKETYLTSAEIVVETMYSNHANEFKKRLGIKS